MPSDSKRSAGVQAKMSQLHIAWKCKNPECKKLFYALGRLTKETRPPPNRTAFLDETTREIRESPCCPFCFSLEFEPCIIEIKNPEAKQNG